MTKTELQELNVGDRIRWNYERVVGSTVGTVTELEETGVGVRFDGDSATYYFDSGDPIIDQLETVA